MGQAREGRRVNISECQLCADEFSGFGVREKYDASELCDDCMAQ